MAMNDVSNIVGNIVKCNGSNGRKESSSWFCESTTYQKISKCDKSSGLSSEIKAGWLSLQRDAGWQDPVGVRGIGVEQARGQTGEWSDP